MIESAFQIVVSLLVGWFGHVLVCRQDARKRLTKAKDEFMAVIADQRAKLANETKTEAFYAESVPVFVAAAYRLRYVLPPLQWERLHAVLTDYERHGYQQFDRFQDLMAVMFKDRGTSRQRLRDFLDQFERSIDENAVYKIAAPNPRPTSPLSDSRVHRAPPSRPASPPSADQ